MLMVAPRGIVKRDMARWIPNLFSAVSRLRGITAADDDVENANNCSSQIWPKNFKGERFPTTATIVE